MEQTRPQYGIDAPPVIRNLGIAAAICFLLAYYFPLVQMGTFEVPLGSYFNASGFWCVVAGILMVVYAKFGKFRHRDRMLAMITWRGNERVLDVGTGRGLLMIGAAKKLGSGKSVGIDIWNDEDLSGNFRDNTLRNASLEGVREKIELLSEDARKMSFSNGTFDVILSNLCLHNISQREGRLEACREIARVLKPGGVALISDFQKTSEYANSFLASGLRVERLGPYFFDTFPPLMIVRATKPV